MLKPFPPALLLQSFWSETRPEGRPEWLPFVVFLLTCIGGALFGGVALTVTVSLIFEYRLPPITDHSGPDDEINGMILGVISIVAFAVGNVFGGLMTGVFTKWWPKTMLVIAALGWILGTVFCTLATAFYLAATHR